eukprot:Opistho-1_new@27719
MPHTRHELVFPELKVDERVVALRVRVRVAVVHIQRPNSSTLVAQCHNQRVRIALHQSGRAAKAHLAHNHRATPLEHGNLRQRRPHRSRARERLVRVHVVPRLLARQVDVDRVRIRRHNGLDEERRANHELVLHRKCRAIGGELDPQRPHDRLARNRRFVEERVEQRQQLVARNHGLANGKLCGVVKEPRLAAARVEMGVRAEERCVGARLVPAHEQLGLRVLEEAADVRARERQPGQSDGHDHRKRRLEVVPVGRVVARPNGAVPLRPGKERPREHKRAAHVAGPVREALRGGHVLVEAVDVVHVPVFPSAVVDGVLVHRYLGAIEYRRLVHVVPRVQARGRSLVLIERKAARPPLAHGGRREVQPRRRARPTPPFVRRHAAGRLDVEALRFGLAVNLVAAVVTLDVRVDDRDHLAPLVSKRLLHRDGVGELAVVPPCTLR